MKTAAGDRDYAVVLKYGGKMDRPGWAAAVRFPLVHTKNIHVERSVVKLCLPESDRWFDFGGTMRLAEQEADVAAQEFFYQNWQLSQLAQVASKSDRFAQARAAANIKALGMEMQKFRAEKRAGIVGNRAMDKAVQANAEAMGQALQQVEQMEKAATRGQPVSRESLNRLFANQRQSRSYNVVNGPGVNFEASPTPATCEKRLAFQGRTSATVAGSAPISGLVPQTGNYGDDSKGLRQQSASQPAAQPYSRPHRRLRRVRRCLRGKGRGGCKRGGSCWASASTRTLGSPKTRSISRRSGRTTSSSDIDKGLRHNSKAGGSPVAPMQTPKAAA